jgi:hypothetical protein
MAKLPLSLWWGRTSWWVGVAEQAAHIMVTKKQREVGGDGTEESSVG